MLVIYLYIYWSLQWSVQPHNPHSLDRQIYHADIKMICHFSGCYDSMLRNMIFRHDYATHFGAFVKCLNFGDYGQLVS